MRADGGPDGGPARPGGLCRVGKLVGKMGQIVVNVHNVQKNVNVRVANALRTALDR